MPNREADSRFLVGVIMGVVVGFAVGLLYAPRAGEETRDLLKKKAEEVKEKAHETVDKIKDAATEARKIAQEISEHP